MPESDDNYESTLEVTISRDMGTLIRVAAEQRALMLVLSGPRLVIAWFWAMPPSTSGAAPRRG